MIEFVREFSKTDMGWLLKSFRTSIHEPSLFDSAIIMRKQRLHAISDVRFLRAPLTKEYIFLSTGCSLIASVHRFRLICLGAQDRRSIGDSVGRSPKPFICTSSSLRARLMAYAQTGFEVDILCCHLRFRRG
jgi:hypothetical protein